MNDLVTRLRDRAHEKRPMPKPFNLLLDAAERISEQDAELERLRREVEELKERHAKILEAAETLNDGMLKARRDLDAERESVADLAAETTRLTDAMIASRLAASEARERLAEALAALEWMAERDDRNGSLPEAYRKKIDETLATRQAQGGEE